MCVDSTLENVACKIEESLNAWKEESWKYGES